FNVVRAFCRALATNTAGHFPSVTVTTGPRLMRPRYSHDFTPELLMRRDRPGIPSSRISIRSTGVGMFLMVASVSLMGNTRVTGWLRRPMDHYEVQWKLKWLLSNINQGVT